MASHFAFLKTPLAREIAVILLIKLALLMGIHALWFATPAPLMDERDTVALHVLGTPTVLPEKNPQ
jgi:hypothetical protein